jgi:hypothetical protein
MLKYPMEVVLLAIIHQQIMGLVVIYIQIAEKITKSYLISLERFWSIYTNSFEIQNLYAKNIIFAYSLPISTST